MAFLMPLVKQNYTLYNSPCSGHPLAQGPTAPLPHRRRKNSDQTDRGTVGGGSKVLLRRNAKSEGTSLSSSPGCSEARHSNPAQGGAPNPSRPVEIRRGRFSVASFLSPQSSLRNSLGRPKLRQTSSVPTTTKSPPPAAKPTFSPSSRSSISSTSSSESTKGAVHFHSRLIMRLRKTLGLGHKEPRPTSA